jgi:hypothetical protein
MWQHWAQRCFIGGVDQDLWADDAMYDDGIGVDTSHHERVTLARQMLPGSGSNWGVSAASTAAGQGYKAFVYNSKLYVLTLPDTGVECRLWRYDKSTDGWTRITSLDTKNIVARSVAVYDGKVFIGGVSSTTGDPKLIYDDGNLGSWTTKSNPSGVTQGIYAMRAFQQKLYVAYGTKVWRMKSDQSWDGNTLFYNVTSASSSNYINAMEVHLGFLYMLSQNGHVHRTDGNSSFDIWSWDGQTAGVAIRSFDGRLFILTFEYTETTNVGWGVLYQMSGSAMTQLKRWGDETNSNKIGNMVVYDRRLWYGATNGLGYAGSARPVFGVAAYDPIEDSHCIVASNMDATTYARGTTPYDAWIVDDQIFFGGQLFCFVRGHGAFRTPYQHRDRERGIRRYDVSAAGASLADQNGGYFTTSTYDAGTPGVDKMWRKVVVDCATPTNTGIVVAYSTNNGSSYTQLGTISAQGARGKFSFYLENIISTSLKLRFTLRSTANTVTPEFFGFNVSYLPTPEPNWMWSMTLVLSGYQELLDGSTDTVDTEAEIAFLEGLYRSQQLVVFQEADGTYWSSDGVNPGVLVYDMTTRLADLTQPLEGEVTLTLLEAVETY